MARTGTIAVALMLVAGTAFAGPFTGRYLIESKSDRGVSISGYIDFAGALMGTTSFNLAATAGFEITASGPGLTTMTYSDTMGIVDADDVIFFDAALGAPVLNPLGLPAVRRWQGKGDLDGEGDGTDAIELRTANNSVGWVVWEDGLGSFDFNVGGPATASPPAWHLVKVPEPGCLLLASFAVVVVWRRKRR